MKKSIRLLLTSLILTPVLSLNACVASITCISHIDKNSDGKCDNCKQKVEIQVSNVEKMTVKTMPNKTYYALNEQFDKTGGVISVTYNDGTPAEDISLDDERLTVQVPGMGSAGKKNVAVKYGGKTITFMIEVGAARFTVNFNLGYDGAEAIPEQLVIINEYAQIPNTPVRDGYDFAGWYADAQFETAFNFEMNAISKDTTIYAKWAKVFTITYDVNYEGGENLHANTVNGKANASIVPAERAGYIFSGWYADAACENAFDFNSEITQDTTVYAKWVSDATTMYTVTFNENYGETPNTTETQVAEGSSVATPVAPTRADVATKGHQATSFTFGGWYTDKECKTAYDFKSTVNDNITLYAKWTGTYIFEAEHVALIDPNTGRPLKGMGASGGSEGPNMVDPPAPGQEGINASNGYYVTYLYSPGLGLYFNITSDRDVADATLIFRISSETVPYALTSSPLGGETENGTRLSQYDISLNGESIEYETIEILDTLGHTATGGKRPFSDHTIAVKLSLKKGVNVFSFVTANMNGMGGTMAATAPVIDCIKVTTSAELSWNPVLTNEVGQ